MTEALQHVLEELRTTGDVITHVTSWRVLAEHPAQYGPWPEGLQQKLAEMLARKGIAQLYRHQSEAVAEALAGRNVVIVTPTASGKTLCYNLPVLEAALRDPEATALYLFPTKALAHDQLATLEEAARMLSLRGAVAAYDGDTSPDRRGTIKRTARLVLTNPDMLHAGILPYHPQWRRFFGRLRYVIIDEIHHYRGIFGSHVANVLRRLARICHFYGSAPQFICCSATIANARELAERLTDETFRLVAESGAPHGERTFLFYNPPVVNEALGLRRPILAEAEALGNRFLARDIQTVLFCRSRLATELLLTHLRDGARRAGREQAAIRGYRGGYLALRRREIEQGLREGSVRGVVATNALELGVDIGGLETSIMVGYPGSIASTWQQAGRAGRGNDPSAALLIASSNPLDQYIIAHPDYFFGQSPEHALINPDNLHLLVSHIKCACFELPFSDSESFGAENLTEILAFLAEEGVVRHTGGKWHWTSADYPAAAVSLRTADPASVTIVSQDEELPRHTIGQLDRSSAPRLLYEGAIYFNEGQQYLVESLDWEAGQALVRPVEVDYYTEASGSTRIDIEQVLQEVHAPHVELARGEVLVTSRVTGYRKMRLGSLEHLGWGEVNLPEQQMLTTACWMMVPEEVVERLREAGCWVGEHVASRGPNWPKQRDLARRRDHFRCRQCGAEERPGKEHDVHHIRPFREFKWIPGENQNYIEANQLANLLTLCPTCHRKVEQGVAVQSTLGGLGRVLGNLIPLLLMCDPSDVGILSDVEAAQTGRPTLFFFDSVPAGVGLSEGVMAHFAELLAKARELVRDCACRAGCPSCIGPAGAGSERAKEQVLRLIEALGETKTSA